MRLKTNPPAKVTKENSERPLARWVQPKTQTNRAAELKSSSSHHPECRRVAHPAAVTATREWHRKARLRAVKGVASVVSNNQRADRPPPVSSRAALHRRAN